MMNNRLSVPYLIHVRPFGGGAAAGGQCEGAADPNGRETKYELTHIETF